MTEDRRGEIGLLLIEATAFTEGLGEMEMQDDFVDDFRETINKVAQKIGVAVEDLESIFRPGFDAFLNKIFPGTTREVYFRRDPEAKKIAIRFWECGVKDSEMESTNTVLNFIRREVVVAKISDEEIREWAKSFLVPAQK